MPPELAYQDLSANEARQDSIAEELAIDAAQDRLMDILISLVDEYGINPVIDGLKEIYDRSASGSELEFRILSKSYLTGGYDAPQWISSEEF